MVVISSISFLPIKAANTSVIAYSCCSAHWLSWMREQTLLMLRWHQLWGDSSDVIATIFGYKGSQYYDYLSQAAGLFLTIGHTRPKIIDTSLTFISRIGQWAFHFPFYLWIWLIQSLWKNGTMQPFDCQGCKTKNHWCFIDAHINDILTLIGWSTIVCQNVYSRYSQPPYTFYVQ